MIPGTPNIFLIYDLNIFFNDSILKCLIAEKNPFISEKRWTVKPSANRKLESIEKKKKNFGNWDVRYESKRLNVRN